MRDWRGNEYNPEKLGYVCNVKKCLKEALRFPCIAEGEENRTHWHGQVHGISKDGGFPLLGLCEKHYETHHIKKWTKLIKERAKA